LVLTHGDEDARQWFVQKFEDHSKAFDVINPNIGQRYEV